MKSEAQLIEQARQGDDDAFGQLVQLHQDRLFSSIMHVVRQREEAEDIVQDAFVQALLKLGSFRGQSAFYTWLYRIAINGAMNRQRRAAPEIPVDPTTGDHRSDPADPADPPAESLLRAERAEQIQAALGRLSDEYRTVLILREIEDFDYETIGRILSISVGTVRSRLHRARSLMREQLARIQRGSTRP